MISALFISGYSAYAMHKKKKKSTKKSTTVVKINNPTNIKSVLMGRAPCYGQCPVYTIEVFETGLLRYTGKSFVDFEGIYEKQVNSADAINFLKEFNKLRPDTLHYMYETKIADLPGIYFYISYADTVKKVLNADAGPRELYIASTKFDAFANIDSTWKFKSKLNN